MTVRSTKAHRFYATIAAAGVLCFLLAWVVIMVWPEGAQRVVLLEEKQAAATGRGMGPVKFGDLTLKAVDMPVSLLFDCYENALENVPPRTDTSSTAACSLWQRKNHKMLERRFLIETGSLPKDCKEKRKSRLLIAEMCYHEGLIERAADEVLQNLQAAVQSPASPFGIPRTPCSSTCRLQVRTRRWEGCSARQRSYKGNCDATACGWCRRPRS
jgi:hypothetical protein